MPQDLTRRDFLTLLTAAGITLAHGTSTTDRTYAAEAARLTRACMVHYWDQAAGMFRAPILSAEAVRSDGLHDRGYVFWPSLIALHALIEGEKRHPGQYTADIARVFDGLEQYWSPDLQAYTAWVRFPGNVDAYYDDNSWAVIVLVEAALACNKAQYLNRATDIMASYIVKAWDDSGSPGGMRWGSDPSKPNTSDRGTSSTAGSALAAMMLARAGVDTAFHAKWGLKLLEWLATNLTDVDGLVMDALTLRTPSPSVSGGVVRNEPGVPSFTVRRIKWTYNTGVPMRAWVEHYRLTKDPKSLAAAVDLAHAAIDRRGALFDQVVHDPNKRYYWDDTYFVHYLVDGLLQVARETGDPALTAGILAEVRRNVDYARRYIRDPQDGFYWRNWRLYAIGEAQLDAWQKLTDQTIPPEFAPSERSQDPKSQTFPINDRPLVKTLLANASAARLLWLTSA